LEVEFNVSERRHFALLLQALLALQRGYCTVAPNVVRRKPACHKFGVARAPWKGKEAHGE
jgi:hypothetical protein